MSSRSVQPSQETPSQNKAMSTGRVDTYKLDMLASLASEKDKTLKPASRIEAPSTMASSKTRNPVPTSSSELDTLVPLASQRHTLPRYLEVPQVRATFVYLANEPEKKAEWEHHIGHLLLSPVPENGEADHTLLQFFAKLGGYLSNAPSGQHPKIIETIKATVQLRLAEALRHQATTRSQIDEYVKWLHQLGSHLQQHQHQQQNPPNLPYPQHPTTAAFPMHSQPTPHGGYPAYPTDCGQNQDAFPAAQINAERSGWLNATNEQPPEAPQGTIKPQVDTMGPSFAPTPTQTPTASIPTPELQVPDLSADLDNQTQIKLLKEHINRGGHWPGAHLPGEHLESSGGPCKKCLDHIEASISLLQVFQNPHFQQKVKAIMPASHSIMNPTAAGSSSSLKATRTPDENKQKSKAQPSSHQASNAAPATCSSSGRGQQRGGTRGGTRGGRGRGARGKGKAAGPPKLKLQEKEKSGAGGDVEMGNI